MSIIIPVNANEFINKEVPRKTRAKIVPLISNAYSLAEQATKDQVFLNWILGYKNVGYLKRIAVEYILKDAIDNGKLPYEYKVMPNRNKSSWHLEIITENAIITTSQVQSKGSLPNQAFYRKKLQEANQLRFSFDSGKDINQGPYHLLITHGYGSTMPSFVNLGFPGTTGWIDYINLLNEPMVVENEDNQRDVDTRERLVSFKDFAKEVTADET